MSRCGIGLLGLGSTPLRGSAGEEAVVGRPVGDIAADEIGLLAIGGVGEIPPICRGRPPTGPGSATMVARAWEAATAEVRHA